MNITRAKVAAAIAILALLLLGCPPRQTDGAGGGTGDGGHGSSAQALDGGIGGAP